MRLLFICGSIEPGRDGVGDYCRNLAIELSRLRITVALLALQDRYIEGKVLREERQGNLILPVLRLGMDLSPGLRFSSAKEFVDQLDPDWLSLQFVASSYDQKGLPWRLSGELAKIGEERKWHIMFHELWVGLPRPVNLKQRVYGLLQKRIIRKIISGISPVAINTSIPLYRKNLLVPGVSILPLFGNISITEVPTEEKGGSELVAVHFGTCTPHSGDWRKQLEWLKRYSVVQERNLKLELIGNSGPNKKQAIRVGEEVIGKDTITDFGWLSQAEISRRFLRADIGISRAGNLNYGKSGSTISMLEHGLPVLLRGKREENRDLRYSDSDNLVYINDSFSMNLKREQPKSRAPEVVQLFLKTLAINPLANTSTIN